MPPGWQRVQTDAFPIAFIAPEELGFRATLGLSNAEFEPPTPAGLASALAATRHDQAADYAGFELLDEREDEIDGRYAYIEHYRWSASAPPASITQLLALVLVAPGKMIKADGAALSQLAQKYVPVLDGIVQSIRFARPTE